MCWDARCRPCQSSTRQVRTVTIVACTQVPSAAPIPVVRRANQDSHLLLLLFVRSYSLLAPLACPLPLFARAFSTAPVRSLVYPHSMIPQRIFPAARAAAPAPHYKRVCDSSAFDVNMACKLDRAPLPSPPLTAPASESNTRFSFDSQSDVDYVSARRSRGPRYERKMGDTELSYFLPSRQTGVNDMYVVPLSQTRSRLPYSPAARRYLHLGFKAKESVTRRSRVCTVWAILRLRHPLLCARAEMHDYDDVRFV